LKVKRAGGWLDGQQTRLAGEAAKQYLGIEFHITVRLCGGRSDFGDAEVVGGLEVEPGAGVAAEVAGDVGDAGDGKCLRI
jgi:hypothetical protein